MDDRCELKNLALIRVDDSSIRPEYFFWKKTTSILLQVVQARVFFCNKILVFSEKKYSGSYYS
jgi:hypothetical protein